MRKIVFDLGACALLLAVLFGVVMQVPSVRGSGTIYIRADGSIDPPTAPIQQLGNIHTFSANISDSIVVERSNIIIDGNGYTLQGSGSGVGFHLSGVNYVTIKNTNIRGFQSGIAIPSIPDSSLNNRVVGNNITGNYYGIALGDSSNYNSISGNNIESNSGHGIWLASASNNSVTGNSIENNGDGIYIHDARNNAISGNNITGSGNYGIWLFNDLVEPPNNRIYHNNFVGNRIQARSETPGLPTQSRVNVWDDGYPSGGNCWSDYAGTDADGDGIGDTPYVIGVDNQDRYPLMNPWTPPEHEIVASIEAPTTLWLGSSTSLKATVTNQGSSNESNVELLLLINGTTVDSRTIPLLQTGNSHTLSYLLTPTVAGTYNITAYGDLVPGEVSIENNQKTEILTIVASPPPGAKVGVKAGDWIKIDYTISGAPAGTPLPQRLKVEFLSVEETSATVRVTMHMSDGTEQKATVPVDVVAGGQALGLSGFVIPANSTVGDHITMGGAGFTSDVMIDGETSGNYAGASRKVVYASFSQLGSQLTYYWDKQTGVIVEASTTSGSITATGKATETNMWEAVLSPFWMQWWFYAIVAVVVAALGGAVYFLKRRKPPIPAASPLPPEGT